MLGGRYGFEENPNHLAAYHYHEHYRRLAIHHHAAGRKAEAAKMELLARHWSGVNGRTEPVSL
jgi:hypothetical protein